MLSTQTRVPKVTERGESRRWLGLVRCCCSVPPVLPNVGPLSCLVAWCQSFGWSRYLGIWGSRLANKVFDQYCHWSTWNVSSSCLGAPTIGQHEPHWAPTQSYLAHWFLNCGPYAHRYINGSVQFGSDGFSWHEDKLSQPWLLCF